MKNMLNVFPGKTHVIKVFILFLLSIPYFLNGQKADKYDIDIVVDCIELAGEGKILAHFGYENTGKKTVMTDASGSVVTYNYGQAKKLGLNTFEPGVHEKAFSQEFDPDDRVVWKLVLPNGNEKLVDASINSNHCRDPWASLNIIPGYYPPVGGKEYNSKIGAELTSLYKAYLYDPGVADAPEEIFQITGTKVLIEAVANSNQYGALLESLATEGFQELTSNLSQNRVTGWVEIGNLLLLNEMDALKYARPVYPGVGNYTVPAIGLTNSQGDFAMHSDFARLGYNIDGSGVKIGVLSNSYNTNGTAGQDVSNGDLPGKVGGNYPLPVTLVEEFMPGHGTLSDEGRAMLQIIHDIAPGAELAFRTGFRGEQDMADGIRQLAKDHKCDIIVDDLSYITEPFFADGVISQAIDYVVDEYDVTFFSSAGNFGNASYMSKFKPAPAPISINGTAHDFSGSGDIFQSVLLEEGNYTLVLQWDDGIDRSMNTTQTDLDLFLSDDSGFALLGFNRENIGGFPIEVVPFSVAGGSVLANIVIAMAEGPPDAEVRFKYILFRGGSQFKIQEYGTEGSSTIVGHPNAAGAITVGAVRFDKNQMYSPDCYESPVIMSFSSVGGTPVNDPELGEVFRNKPDFTAPNGVNTTVNLGNGDWVPDPGECTYDPDPDTYPNFFGTSAASPHAAGMAALIMQAKLKFDLETITPEDIRAIMKTSALEMDDPEEGYNYVSGSGFIQAHKALMQFANPTPYVENLILISEGSVEGEVITPASFTVTGDFFTNETQILFRGEPLTTGVVVQDESTIIVEHPPFLGDPMVQAYNTPVSASLLDGGVSDPVYFSDPVKRKIFIKADALTKKYGEAVPNFKGVVLVEVEDGEPVSLIQAVESGIMLPAEADRLSILSFDLDASAISDAGEYIIIPSLDPVLDLENPQNELETEIIRKYIPVYLNASLIVEKLALRITPENVEMVYGMQLPGVNFTYSYEIDDAEFTGNPGLIETAAELEHTTTLTNKVALARGIALVNGIPMIRGIALVNGVSMTRGIALVNGIEVRVEEDGSVYVAGEPVENGVPLIRGIALVNDLPFVSMTEIVRGIALVNGTEVHFEDGYMSLDENPLENGIPVVRGIALVNGEAMVGDVIVSVVDGKTYIGTTEAPTEGIVEINGIPLVRGIALVNSSLISRGIALVNDVAVPIENGMPAVRGIALVNGIPMTRGIALVNDLKVTVENGLVEEVLKANTIVNGLTFSRGIALVNDVALVNYTEANIDFAIENGIALINEEGQGLSEDLVNLENMNVMASSNALTNNLQNLRGIALVNDLEGVDGAALKEAVEFIPEDENLVVQNVNLVRGIALVNGLAYTRGIALVNTGSGTFPITSGIPLVNGTEINDDGIQGTIMVFDAADVEASVETTVLSPMSFITGTTAGQHWIIPGTFISNNFDISYGLGTLTIFPAPVSVTVTALDKIYDGTVIASISMSDNLPDDADVAITYKSASFDDKHVGENKSITISGLAMGGPDADNFSLQAPIRPVADITVRTIAVSAQPDSKAYDGTVSSDKKPLYEALMGEDAFTGTPVQVFDSPNAGSGKILSVSDLIIEDGNGGANYAINYVDDYTGEITPLPLTVYMIPAILSINEGDPLPENILRYEGVLEGESLSCPYTVVREDGVRYEQNSDESAGKYIIEPLPCDNNYIFVDPAFGLLYVNPYGPGTRAIKPELNCVEQIGPDLYIANLEYKNDNSEDVYIPIGDDNMLTGGNISLIESDEGNQQPTLFKAGGGFFRVYFDGTGLSWVVNSLDEDHKVSSAANANSSSTKCKKDDLKSASVSSEIQGEPDPDRLVAYPVPVVDRLHIRMKDIENYRMIMLYDFAGRSVPIKSIEKRSDMIEIDMAQLASGPYFIRIVMEDTARVVQLIKK